MSSSIDAPTSYSNMTILLSQRRGVLVLIFILVLSFLVIGMAGCLEGPESTNDANDHDTQHDDQTPGVDFEQASDPLLTPDRPIEFNGPGLYHIRLNVTSPVEIRGINGTFEVGEDGPLWLVRMRLDHALSESADDGCGGIPQSFTLSNLGNTRLAYHSGTNVLDEGIWDFFGMIREKGAIHFTFNETVSREPRVIDEPSLEFQAAKWREKGPSQELPEVPEYYELKTDGDGHASSPGITFGGLEVRGRFIGEIGQRVQIANETGTRCAQNEYVRESFDLYDSTQFGMTVASLVHEAGIYSFNGSFSAQARWWNYGYEAELYTIMSRSGALED